MGERDFELNGRNFKLSKIDAFKQFHIVRRIGPILSEILPAMRGFKDVKNFDSFTESEKLESITQLAAPFLVGISKLSDADAELVLYGLLSAVETQQPQGNWAKIVINSMLMFQDMELPVLMQIAAKSFAFNLSGFFSGLPQ